MDLAISEMKQYGYSLLNHLPKNPAQLYIAAFVREVVKQKPYKAMSYLLNAFFAFEQLVESESEDMIIPAMGEVWDALEDIEWSTDELPSLQKVVKVINSEQDGDKMSRLFSDVQNLRKGNAETDLSPQVLDEPLQNLSEVIKEKADTYFETAQEMLTIFDNRFDEIETLLTYYHFLDHLRLSINTLLLGTELDGEEQGTLQYLMEELLGHSFENLFEKEITVYAS